MNYLPLMDQGNEKAQRDLPPHVIQEEPLHSSRDICWFKYPELARRLRERIERVVPDIIHAGPIHLGATLVALTGFHPLVSMSWGSDILWDSRKPWVALAVRYTLKRSDAFVGDCQAVKSAAIRYGMEQERIILFPWGVDLRHFSPGSSIELRKKLGWEENFIFISTRSLEQLYGVDLIVKSFIKIARQFTDARLLLLGDGSLRAALESWLDQAGLLSRVYFAGVVDRMNLPEFYRSADVYISASRSDGSSVSLMEAMSCGLPALVSDIPGNCEWVQPEVNGWRFRDGDLNSLVNTLGDVIRKRHRISDMGVTARDVAEKRADWDKNFPNLLRAYDIAFSHTGNRQ